MLSKICQTEKKKIPYGPTYMWNLKEKKKKKQVTDSDNRLVLPGVWGEGWAKRVKEVKRYRFTVIE